MPAKKNVTLVNGGLAEVANIIVSAGSADDGKTVGLDSTGKLHASVIPLGIGADTNLIVASEALIAGDLVNIWDNAGAFNVRKASAALATNYPANGFVLSAVASGATATVYAEGTDTALSGLTPGEQFLSITTAGRTQAASPTVAGQISQKVGVAVSATSINFQQGVPVLLA